MRIIITGASDGIGKVLALTLSKKGVFLFLIGRNLEKLQTVKKECEQKGSNVKIMVIDVINSVEMKKNINIFSKDGLDIVIANAGICLDNNNIMNLELLINTNFYGMLNTILPAIEIMKKNKKGIVIASSSIVSYNGLENLAGYCASKGAIRIYLEGMSKEWEKFGIKTKIILNGFVKTNMNKLNINYEKMMSPQKAAEIIINSINNNKIHIHFPFKYKIIFFFKMIYEFFK